MPTDTLIHRSSMIRLVHAWESIQVELHGRYSPARLSDLQQYMMHRSLWMAIAVAASTPLPCLFTILFFDSMPLKSIHEGLQAQTIGFYLRVFFTGWIVSFLAIDRFSQCHSALHLTHMQHWGIATFINVLLMLSVYGCILLIGFPIPFAMQTQTPLWILWHVLALGYTWRDVLRRDPIAASTLKKTVDVFSASTTIIIVYIAYTAALSAVDDGYKTLLSCLLPLMKLLFRNWVHHALLHEEDLAPVMVVLGVDAFHALFVSVTMQQVSASSLSTAFIMGVDAIQGLIAFHELRTVLLRLDRVMSLAEKSQLHRLGLVAYGVQLLETSPSLRSHPDVGNPRHIRLEMQRTARVRHQSCWRTWTKKPKVNAIAVAAGPSALPLQLTVEETLLAKTDIERLPVLLDILKLLHMTEFYVLIEFAEFSIAGLYAAYLGVLSTLPNRVFYAQFTALTDEQLTATTLQVTYYALFELASFVVFCAVMDGMLPRFSSLRQLGFALHKHWRMVQSSIIGWSFMVMQITLEHFGEWWSCGCVGALVDVAWLTLYVKGRTSPSSSLGYSSTTETTVKWRDEAYRRKAKQS